MDDIFRLVALYLSQLAVIDVITDQIGHKKFLKQFNQFMHLPKEQNTYEVKSERTGPALNIKITKKRMFKIPFLENVMREPLVIFDADFTLALQCPKFPKDAKRNIFLTNYFFLFLLKNSSLNYCS